MEQEFVFSLPQFEGSLDLLLYLVKKHEMDVKDIKISIIADEFLNYINQMKRLNINIAADFMVMASTLMELKSKILLPNKSSEDIESIRKAKQELSERLVAYQQMKKLANKFKEKLDEALKLYSVRVKAEKTSDLSIKPENFSKLQELFEHVSRIIKAREKVYRIKSEKYSVAKKMEEIYETIQRKGKINLEDILVGADDRVELIVMFLAILELIKLNKISLEILENKYSLEVVR
ncbi:MAG: segregation and condensation protein [Thermotogaceae bacterium]|jgi:segregation and condensation protein A|nr:segregation and condensation protein [Thermotogaceae bacterium]MDN5337679.1 segregation and condensation protein [Thermotogaceae bacterium]